MSLFFILNFLMHFAEISARFHWPMFERLMPLRFVHILFVSFYLINSRLGSVNMLLDLVHLQMLVLY